MIEKLTKNITQFYQISFIAIMLAALGLIFYFWKLGFIDGSRSKELHKAGYTLENLQKGAPALALKKSILKENPKKVVEEIEILEKEMQTLHRLVEDESYLKVFEELQKTKTSAADMLSFQKSSKVVSVFNDKMENFSEFAQKNNWRTLTRMSQRVLSVSQQKMSADTLPKAVETIEKDFASMVKVTENSVLSRAEKSEIISRITSLKTETGMLKKFLMERESALELANSAQVLLSKWLNQIAPELSYQKLKMERMGRYYVMGMLGILGLASSLFFLGFFFKKWSSKKSRLWLEENLKELMADGIIGRGELKEELFSEDFQEFAQRTSEYVNKRMSFGAIFQDALPFSSLMLDKNLKVEWANKQFCSDWEMSEDEAGKDYMSWDYLSKLTNLGHDDPVLEALKNDVAGIYQIQIRPNEDAETRPYEMFVSPVKYNHQKKIMLFFYPLLSMRETIKDQAVSIVNPIDKTLRLMLEDRFERLDKQEAREDSEQLRKEYEIGGITNILDMFEKLATKASDEKRRLLNQIEMLYASFEKAQASSDQVYDLNAQAFSSSKEQIKDLKAFKEGVIALTEAAKSFEGFHRERNKTFKEVLNSLEKAQNDFGTLKNSMEDMAVSLPDLDALKEAIKSNRAAASESKAKLAQGLANFIHIKKGISHPEVVKKFQTGYEKVYGHFQEMDERYIGLDRRLVQLEVALSKTQMIINSAQNSTNQLKTSQDLAAVKTQMERNSQVEERGSELEGKASESEELIVGSLQALYKGYKENLKRQALIAKNLEISDQYQFKSDPATDGAGETTM
ncbi:MAG: hypothetical protein WD025_08220 [Bacteriovoracaceae bacterium]